MKTIHSMSFLILALFLGTSCNDDKDSTVMETCPDKIENLKINQYQTLGSHNSYRKNTQPEIVDFMNASAELLPEGFSPASWDYTHETFEDQLNIYGLRSFELDVYRDPEGGLFNHRLGNAFVGLDTDSGEDKLSSPGLKILHFPDFDYHTHFFTFVDALEALQSWSNSNPNHLPITILIEAKEDNPAAMLPGFGLTSTLDFSGSAVEEIESEINTVFASDQNHILKPDDVRGSNSILRNAITTKGWPKLSDSRGKIMFVLMGRNEVVDSYINGHPSLEGRNMFVFTDADKDEAAFLSINDPEANLVEIQNYIDEGFIVRTRADADTEQARTGSYTRMNSAFESGAQIINTDYYRPDPRSSTDTNWTDYEVKFANNNLALIHAKVIETENIDCDITE
jgi:hypothetical protein